MKVQFCVQNLSWERLRSRQMQLFMKMLFLLLTVGSLHVTAAGFAQKVSVDARNLTVRKLFSLIKEQTGYTFFYPMEVLKDARKINVKAKDVPLATLLEEVCENQSFTFSIEGKVIVIRPKSGSTTDAVPTNSTPNALTNNEVKSSNAPQVTITGKVFGDGGEPLAGAVILLKGTKKAAVSNADGIFNIELTTEEAVSGTLVFTFVGYHKREYKVSGHNNISITLVKNIQELDGFVVTNAYTGEKRKEEVVGSISKVTAEQLQTTRPIESFDKMLEGLAPGVQVIQSTELGTPVSINVRGQNSLPRIQGSNITERTTSSQPLFVVDGVPVFEQRRADEPILFLNNEQLLNPLAGINPDDIESISILKDAAATSIYGANASNGVIIITTKKGKAGKTRVNAGYSTGLSRSINKIKWLDGPQYKELLRETYLNDGRTPFDAELLSGAADINTPWFELVNRYGTFQNLDLDFSGGTENTNFYVSGSYFGQQAIQKGNDYQKLFLRMRLDHKIGKKLQLSLTMAPSTTNKNALNTYSLVPLPPNIPSYNADGSFYKLASLGVPNPLAVLDQNTNKHSGGSFNGNISLSYKILPNLQFFTRYGVDALINKLTLFNSPLNTTGENLGGTLRIYDRQNIGWISSSQLSWNQNFNQKHKLEVTAGFEAMEQATRLLLGQGSGFTYSRIRELSNATNQTSGSSRQNTSNISVYGQAMYHFSNKYHVSFSSRYDAASIFGTDVNATVNSAVGMGWNINQEKFLKEVNWVDLLRIRASYGTAGNSRIGSFESRGMYNFSNTGYNDQTSAVISTAPNPDLSWERSYKKNLGVDFDFLRRFNITVDVYENIIDDLISPLNIPVENGFREIQANVSKMRNRGLDVGIRAQIFTGKFRWTSTLNMGMNKGKVLEVKDNATRFASSNQLAALLRAGISSTAIWGFRFAGVDPQTGREQYFDNTGRVVSVFDLDRNLPSAYYLGDRLPDLQGGFINTFGYKGLTLTVNILYSIGAELLVDYQNENNGRNLQNRNQSVNLLDRWKQPGDRANIPRLNTGAQGSEANPIVANSSKYLYEDTYLKLSNITLGWQVPGSITRHLNNARITVYANGTNLFYWYKEKSPEGRNGIREYKYLFPEAQTFTWGLKVGL